MARILCIEDEIDLREDLADELREAGHQVFEAADGREGLHLAVKHRPDLILCDMLMPEMNGAEVLTALRADHPEMDDIGFLFLTALADQRELLSGLNLGADDYLTKPVDYDVLHAVIGSRLQQRSRNRALRSRDMEEMRQSVLQLFPHEMLTPLNHIIGLADLIAVKAAKGETEDYLERVGLIKESGLHLLSLVKGVLTLTDAAHGRLTIAAEPLDLKALVERSMAAAAPMAEKNGVVLSAQVADGLPPCESDGEFVQQALDAIVSNAVKFTPDGGTVTLDVSNGEGGATVIRVTDTGIGIAAADLPRVVEPFFQADRGMGRHFDGMGLGLSLVFMLAGRLGGHIELESASGEGTTVTMTLPGPAAVEDEEA